MAHKTDQEQVQNNEARVILEVAESKHSFKLDHIDFDQSRKDLAMNIGGLIIDTIYNELEGNVPHVNS